MEEKCCDYLIPEEWDKKEIVWRDKPFYKTRYWSFLHVPINLGKKIIEGVKKIQQSGLTAEQMMLSQNDGMWGAELLIPISGKTDRFEVEYLTGRFLTRLFEGHYGDMRKWIKETQIWCKENGRESDEFIFWYATCPKCAKKRKDMVQVVIFAKVE
jgi:hypothetical protein